MPEVAAPAAAGGKRKRPPTFHHYPANRAKKLKKAWVEKAKIRSKWTAQKQKEALSSTLSHQGESKESADNGDDKDDEQSGGGEPRATRSGSEIHVNSSKSQDDAGVGRHKPRDKDNTREESPRKLFQKAYSKTSLHTYKSDPLKRRRNHTHNEQGSSRRGRGAAPTRGRGQPDMKLRMNAMLEKIKRDYT